MILTPAVVFGWLNQFSHSYLSPLTRRQIENLRSTTFGFEREVQALRRNVLQALNPLEQGEALLSCALSAFERGELHTASQFASEAETLYAGQPGQLHRQAIAGWIGGAIHFRLNNNLLGYTQWCAARRAFATLAQQAAQRRAAERARWYHERLAELQAELAGRIEEAFTWLYLFRENRADDLDWLILDNETRRQVLEGRFERDALPLEVWLRVQSGILDWFSLPPQIRRRIQFGNLDLHLRRLFDNPAPQTLTSAGSLALANAVHHPQAPSPALPGRGTQMGDSDPHLRQLLPAHSAPLIRRQYVMRILRLIQNDPPRYASAYELMGELESLTAAEAHPRWLADTYTELGFLLAQMQLWTPAADYLHKAVAGYPVNSHQQAAACWMLGLVYAAEPQNQPQAVKSWQRALTLFETLRLRADQENQQNACQWYRERIPILRMLLADRIDDSLRQTT